MAQLATVVAVCALGGYLLWTNGDRLFEPKNVHVTIRLDRPEAGARLICDIVNTGDHPVTRLTKLIVRARGRAAETVPFGLPAVLAARDRVSLPTDVDWTMLEARFIGVADAGGREHRASKRQVTAIQDQVRPLIDRRATTRQFAPSPPSTPTPVSAW